MMLITADPSFTAMEITICKFVNAQIASEKALDGFNLYYTSLDRPKNCYARLRSQCLIAW